MLRLLPLATVLALAACDATNVVPNAGQAGAPEAIDSLRLIVTGVPAGSPTSTLTVTGAGSTPVTLDTLFLRAGVTYNGRVALEADLDEEIQAEAESHLYTYAFDSAATTLRRTDRESQYATGNLNDGDYPLGRTFQIVADTTASGTGALTVRLSHFEGAPKAGADDTSGTADLALTIPVRYLPPAP